LKGRHKGGETWAQQLDHEGFVEMGKKGGLASYGADPYEALLSKKALRSMKTNL